MSDTDFACQESLRISVSMRKRNTSYRFETYEEDNNLTILGLSVYFTFFRAFFSQQIIFLYKLGTWIGKIFGAIIAHQIIAHQLLLV